MIRALRAFWVLVKQAAIRFDEEDCSVQAAAIAYYSIFSLPGVLVLVVRLVGFWLGNDRVQERLVGLLSSRLGSDTAETLGQLAASGPTWQLDAAALLAGGALVFSATTAFAQVQSALNRVWKVAPEAPSGFVVGFLIKRAIAFAMIVGAGVLLLLSMTARAVLSAARQFAGDGFLTSTGAWTLEWALSLTVTTVLFAGIFRAVPDATVQWRDALPGGALTAILFTLGNRLVGVYFHFVPVGGVYGPAGSLALILFWLYFVAMLLLFGAAFTQAYARLRGRALGGA